jgi:DNA-directed RNA polymerase subunit RPC12/RpoP
VEGNWGKKKSCLHRGAPVMSHKKRRHPHADTAAEASYICQYCGEEIVIPLDVTAGDQQQYVEDCPVCCHALVIHVEVFEDGETRVWSESEN